jgi:hypothetical protein
MQTRTLAAVAVVIAVVPALVSIGCNKKEDLAPAPSATQAAAPPPAATPPPAPTPAPAPAPVAVKTSRDAGAKGAAVVLAIPDAAPVAIPSLPQIPTIQPSALPAIASGIVGGIVGALPSGLIPPPVAPDK